MAKSETQIHLMFQREKSSNFLTEKFGAGASYGSLNSMRSAVSLISAKNITQSKEISRFFKGVYKLRPLKPKYDKIWDIEVVFSEVSRRYPLEELNLKTLT